MYTDLLIRIKNAQLARKDMVRAPFSNADLAVAELLHNHGFVASATKKGRAPKRIIEVALKYDEGRGAITDVRFISKSSRRLYAGYREISSVRGGFGIAVVSTSKGIMAASDARKQKVGGELLFEIW